MRRVLSLVRAALAQMQTGAETMQMRAKTKCANGDDAVRIRARVGSVGFDRARADDGGHRGDVARECGGGFSRDLPCQLLVASRGGGTRGLCAAFAMPPLFGRTDYAPLEAQGGQLQSAQSRCRRGRRSADEH
jgi:hypothetical protein